MSLCLFDLIFVLLLIFGELSALQVGLDHQPDLEPEPGLGHVPVPDRSLDTEQSELLVL